MYVNHQRSPTHADEESASEAVQDIIDAIREDNEYQKAEKRGRKSRNPAGPVHVIRRGTQGHDHQRPGKNRADLPQTGERSDKRDPRPPTPTISQGKYMPTTNCATYGHDWADTQPTRLRAPKEDDELLRCTKCGQRRFVNPGATTIDMPTGFSPITLHTLHYDTTTGPSSIPSTREIHIRPRNGLPQMTAIKRIIDLYPSTREIQIRPRNGLPRMTTLKRIMDLYPKASIAAIANTWPEARGKITFRPWHELPTETKDNIADLADGPVSAYLLTTERLLKAATIPYDQPSERISVHEHVQQWLHVANISKSRRHSTLDLLQICADPAVEARVMTAILTHVETNAQLPAGSLQEMSKIRPMTPSPATHANTELQLAVSPSKDHKQHH